MELGHIAALSLAEQADALCDDSLGLIWSSGDPPGVPANDARHDEVRPHRHHADQRLDGADPAGRATVRELAGHPGVRYNDTTDIWYPRGGAYGMKPSRSFGTARLAKLKGIADLGLYSMTFSNDVDYDLRTLSSI